MGALRCAPFSISRAAQNRYPFQARKLTPMAGRYYLKTFGCQMNEYDSARIADVLRGVLGLEGTDDPAAADLLLMNTCSVREKAQEKVYSLLGEWRALKQQRPGLIIGVGG